MPQGLKSFILGIVCSLLLGAALLYGIDHRALIAKTDQLQIQSGTSEPQQAAYPPIPPDAIKIQPLPPLNILSGAVKFEGKQAFPQKLSGSLARNVVVVKFNASGENAQKSAIRIVWTDDSADTIPPGTSNVSLPQNKIAKQIIIQGYAMHERRILKDLSRPGTLEWEIRYEVASE